MTPIRQWGSVLVLPLLLNTLATPAAFGESPRKDKEEFFKSTTVIDLKIEVAAKEVEALRREPRKYVRASLTSGSISCKDVGIHLKGAAGSYRDFNDKPCLTLNADKFTDEQRFLGMDKFHLSNSVQDPSYLSELICGELFRAAGVPASRVGHALVTINGRHRGLYYIKEGYDGNFLKQHFGNRRGNFYDGGFLRDIDQPLQVVSSQNDVKDHADLKKLLTAGREKDITKRFGKMQQVLDVDRFISFMVLEVITWDWDGYPLNRNNYRIYHDPMPDKLVFIPSGMDQMFADPNGSILPGFQGFVARALLETPEGRARYLARMEEIITKVYKTEDLLKRLDELQARVQPALASIDPGAGRDYPNQVNRLRNAIKQREKSVLEQLKRMKK